MKSVIIDGQEYRRVEEDGEELRIVIVDNSGLTFVGKVNIKSTDPIMTIRDARCIIRWGTTHHIAQLVDGPTQKTRLGAKADVDVFRSNCIISYRVTGDWGI